MTELLTRLLLRIAFLVTAVGVGITYALWIDGLSSAALPFLIGFVLLVILAVAVWWPGRAGGRR